MVKRIHPSYSGFYASLTNALTKHKAYYHVTLPNLPKKGVVYNIMQRWKQAAEEKLTPFIQLIGDQPLYALVVEVKNKNQGDFEKYFQFLEAFIPKVPLWLPCIDDSKDLA